MNKTIPHGVFPGRHPYGIRDRIRHGKALLASDSVKVLATLHLGLQSPEHADFVKKLAKKKAK